MAKKEIADYHKELFNHFGFNFGFVADLLEKYLEDKISVSEYWRNYFDKLTSEDGGETVAAIKREEKTAPKRSLVLDSFEISPEDEPELITGVGAKIIENMESSLTIPTATSLRTISVKLLAENRRIINQQLKRLRRGKVSYTHLAAFGLVKALKKFPELNNSFAILQGNPS